MNKEASPWMTRREAADYLRVSVDTIDRRMVEGDKPTDGKFRFKRLPLGNKPMVRLWREDVLRLLSVLVLFVSRL